MSYIILLLLFNPVYSQTMVIPSTCDDLLPDIQDYINFTEEAAEMMVSNHKDLSSKVYELLTIRKLYQNKTTEYYNPIDNLIKDYLCFCYEKNNKQLFTSNSDEIRDFLQKHIDKMISKAEDKYIQLRVTNQIKYLVKLQALKNRKKIRTIKQNAFKSIKKRLNIAIEKQLEKLSRN